MKKPLAIILCITMILTAALYSGAPAAAADEAPAPTALDAPKVHIVTDNNDGLSLQKTDGYIGATVTVTDTDGTVIEGAAEVKIRGNSTSRLNKKSYTVKFSKKQDVLGMGKAKKWALVANAFDPTLLRNYVAFETADELGLEYTSQKRFVEVWVDESYRGCYLLLEPVQEGKTRVDIDIESNCGMKDFLIEREYNHVDEGAVYFTAGGIRFLCSDPDEPNAEQLAYIRSTMDDIINTMKKGTRREIEEKADIASFAKYYLLNEFVKDVDVDYSSVFFYYKDGKLYAGPVWDYDLSLGNEDVIASANYAAANKTDELYCNNRHLFRYLCSRSWFFDEVRRVYLDHCGLFDDIGAPGGLIARAYEENSAVILRNFSQAGWKYTTYYPLYNKKPFSTLSENLDYFMDWCSQRAAWLKTYFTEDVTEYLAGDSNSDSDVNILDATAIQRRLADMVVSGFDAVAADADGDGNVTIIDATAIQRFLAELDTDSPIGETMYHK